MRRGRLYGLGLGPGDPELVTLKALRLLRQAPVVAYPATMQGDSFARGIVAAWLDRGQHEIALRFPMRPGPVPAAIYREAAGRIAAALGTGQDVAYLCQGDPLFYGSFAGILDCLAGDYAVEIVPGVSAPMACAAAAGVPLTRRNEALTVVPATLPDDELARRIAGADAAAVVKLGRHFAKLRRVLAALDRLDGALYIERASLPNQGVAPLAEIDPASVPYFATALIPGRNGRV